MGSTLHIMTTDENGLKKVILTENVLKDLTINGIETLNNFENDSKIETIVCIYGNRFISLYKFSFDLKNETHFLSQLLESHNFYDWILSVKMSANNVFVVKAHNEVIIFDYNTKQTKDMISGTDKCILYSAELLLMSEMSDSFVLFSGTVFKEIIVWTSYRSPDQKCLVSKNLQRLKGHDGVIFALNYSKSLNLLVSASDDRSVRIWSSSLNPKDFCDSIDFWSKNTLSLCHVFYGHLSRIWSVVTITDPFPLVISVGEDSSVYFWDINKKKLIQRADGHKNSSIWSLCVDIESNIAFIGGSDSCLTSCDITNSVMPLNSLVRHDIKPKQIKLLSLSGLKIFCSTISGSLLMSDTSLEDITENSDYNNIFQTYSTIEINKKRNEILLGSKCGTIASINFNLKNENPFEVQIKRVQKSKVFSICFVDSFNFIVCGIEGEIKLLSLKTFDRIGEYFLPNSRHRWPVSAILHKKLLIIGDRCGSIFVFLRDNPNPVKEFRHIHGSNGVTAIKVRPNTQLMYSSGRNGKIFEFLIEDNNCWLLRTFRILSDMEWIGNFEFDEQTNEMSFIYGFQSRNFVVWDEREQRFVYSIECGGGHRSWDFAFYENNFHFCYTKQEKIISFAKQMSKTRHNPKLFLTQTSHSKKINSCSLLLITSSMFFATAGEENIIHINSLNIETNEWKIESYLFGHISNISAISSVCDLKSNSCFMVTVGGRAQLMFWKIQFKDNQLFCRQLFNKFLWPSDVIQNRCHKTNNFYSSTDPQIRYLDVNMNQKSKDKYLISTACSDSSFRLFVFDSKEMTFRLVNTTSFNTSCVLKVLNVFDSHLITASNDGILKIWSISEQFLNESELNFDELNQKPNQKNLEKVFERQSHESGVNAMDVFLINNFEIKDNLWLIASGGDDNTLSLSVLKVTNECLDQISYIENKSIHSSQITGKVVNRISMIIFLYQFVTFRY